jgi:hypothetical protein
MKSTTQSTEEILRELNIAAPWIEARGAKRKYFFHQIEPGQVITRPVSLRKSRAVHTAMLKAAKNQGIHVTIQNKGLFLKIKRIK